MNLSKIRNIVITVATIIGTVVGVLSYLNQSQKNNPTIEIKSVTLDKLTDLPKVDGLNAEYRYKDSLVYSLWKLNYEIKNIGNRSVIGKGNNKDLINNAITFYFPKNYNILEFKCSQDSLPFNFTTNNNELKMEFLQWKANESFDITFYIEELTDNQEPILRLDDREIRDGNVKYTSIQIQEENQKKQPIFSYLPLFIQDFLWWLVVVFSVILILGGIAVFIDYLIKKKKYLSWWNSNEETYKEWVKNLIDNNKLDKYHKPSTLPNKLWGEYPHNKPLEIPDNNIVIGVLTMIIIFGVPLLILIKI